MPLYLFLNFPVVALGLCLVALYLLARRKKYGEYPLPPGPKGLPIIGNLLSNTVIVVVSVTQGLWISALSLAFLVTIHKLEYLLNAHFVGIRIRTKAYELLAIMLLFEAMFGLAGLVMAPIVYAYAKAELRAAGWL